MNADKDGWLRIPKTAVRRRNASGTVLLSLQIPVAQLIRQNRKSSLLNLTLLDPLHWMQQHAWQTHASAHCRLLRVSVVTSAHLDAIAALAMLLLLATDNLLRLAPLVNLDLPAQPSSVDVLGEARAEVPRPTIVVVLAITVVRRVGTLRPTDRVEVTVEVGVEDCVDVVRRPYTVEPNGLRSVDSLQAVLECDGGGPHFSLHAATDLILDVHRVEHALAETCDRVDKNAARDGDEARVSVSIVVRVDAEIRVEARNVVPDLVTVRPESANRVEHRQECDEISLFTNAPFILVCIHFMRRHGANRSLHWRVGLGTPNGAGNLALAPGVFDSLVRVVEVGLIITMKARNVVALVTLPKVLPGLVPGEVLDLAEEVVVLASVTSVGLPVPNVVELRVRLAEPLNWHKLVPVHLPVGNLGVSPLADVLVPEDGDAAQLSGDDLLEHVVVSLGIVEDRDGAVLDVHEEENLEFTAREKRSLLNHGANCLKIVVGVGVALPSTDQNSGARVVLLGDFTLHLTGGELSAVGAVAECVDVSLGDVEARLEVGLLSAGLGSETLVVPLNTLVLQLAPVDFPPDNLLFLDGLPIGQVVLVRTESVSTVAAIAIEANVGVQTQALDRSSRRLRELGRDLRIGFDQIQITLVEGLATGALASHVITLPLLLPLGAVVFRVREVRLGLGGLFERFDSLSVVSTLTSYSSLSQHFAKNRTEGLTQGKLPICWGRSHE